MVSLIGVFLMWCPGRPFTATTTGSRAGRLAGNPPPLHLGSSAPTRWGAPHVGSHSVVPRCGAGGAPRWWGPTLLGAPHPASPRLTLRTTWSSRSLRPLLTVSLVLTVSLRRTTRLHGYLTNDGDSPGGDPPPQEGSRERPTDATCAEFARALPSGSPTPAVTGVAHVVSPGVEHPSSRGTMPPRQHS